MSSSIGGSYILLQNNGKFDEILTGNTLVSELLDQLDQNANMTDYQKLNCLKQTHNWFLDSSFKPYINLAQTYMAQAPAPDFGMTSRRARFSLDQVGNFINDMVLNIRFAALGSATNTITTYRYCSFPGIRLIKRISFTVNGNPIDTYTRDDVVFYNNFNILAQKRATWEKCMGQEDIKQAKYYDPDAQVYQTMNILNGPQTPKTLQPELELAIPLKFWCCIDPSQSFISCAVPNGQRVIEVEFASVTEMVQAALFPGAVGTPTPADLRMTQCTLIVNNIFVNDEFRQMFIERRGYYLMRTWRTFTKGIMAPNGNINLSETLKWPVETLYFAFQPVENQLSYDSWIRMGKVVTRSVCVPVVQSQDVVGPPFNKQLLIRDFTWSESVDQIVNVALKSDSNYLFPPLSAKIYNAYIPWRLMPPSTISSSPDPAAFMLSFALYPGINNPSGHINASRMNKLQLEYSSEGISASSPVNFIMSAVVMNVISYTDGTLRYMFTN